MAARIRSRSRRPSRRSDLSAAGRISIRQPAGLVRAELRLGLGPLHARLAARLEDRS
jgi:hypothetical protein